LIPQAYLRAPARFALVALAALAFAACSAADAIVTGGFGPAQETALAKHPTLLVATNRKPAANPGEKPWFGAGRGRGLAFAEAQLSGPDRSLTGRVASVVTGDWAIASVGPAREAGAAQAFAQAALGRDVLLYVHGYRESFETAAFSAAQLADGIRFRGATGLFAWPRIGMSQG
jgi:esterase/lipase superfamily enzyme